MYLRMSKESAVFFIENPNKKQTIVLNKYCLHQILDSVVFGLQSCVNTDVFVLCAASEIFDYFISFVAAASGSMEWADGHDFKSEQTLQICLTLLGEGCWFFFRRGLRHLFKWKPLKLGADFTICSNYFQTVLLFLLFYIL